MTDPTTIKEPEPKIAAIDLNAVGVGDGFDTKMDELEFDRFVHASNDEIPVTNVKFVCHPLLPLE
ncbi:MAG: hypothetical protein R8K20_07110 [Gallionellaceae bacterium]